MTITHETDFSNGFGLGTISQRIIKEKCDGTAGRYSKESEPNKSGNFTVYAQSVCTSKEIKIEWDCSDCDYCWVNKLNQLKER